MANMFIDGDGQSPDPRYTLPMSETEQRIRSENPNAPPQDLPYERGGPRGSRPGKPEPLRNPPDAAIDTDRTYGGNRLGGNTYGGNTYGGNTFGGNTYGGNTFGGNRFGASSRQTPSGVGAGEQPSEVPPTRPTAHDEAGGRPLQTWTPDRMEQPEGVEGQPGAPTEPRLVTSDDEASFRPGPLPKKPGTPGGKPSAGGGGGAGTAGGRRKPLGDQSRTEAYDPTLDRADPRNVAIIDEKGRVNPKTWEDAQKGAIDPTKPGVKTGEAAAKYTNHYTAALQGATDYMTEMFHQKKGDPNQAEGYHAMTFKGVGAPDPKIVADVFNVVDPKNELAPKERMELATRAMHDFYQAKGDQGSANKVTAEILQFGNQQAKVFGNQALAAMKSGDRTAATDAIQKAYDWLPDGFHATVANNKLTITNDKGQTVSAIPLDDKQIANLGTGLATGTLYWDVVQQRAGKPGTFVPPTQSPQQAIAPTVPGPPAAGPGRRPMDERPDAGPTTPIPGGAPGGVPPAAAAPGARTAAAPAPPAPQTAGAPSAAPSGAPTPPAAASPAAAPGLPRPPPPPPQVIRPAAPAPAAPGPAPTPQAAPPAPVPAPSAPAPAPTPAPAQVITPQTPPALQGPVQPTTTKRPIVEGAPTPAPPPPPTQQQVTPQPSTTPAQGSGGPSGSPAGPSTQQAQQAQPEPVRNKDDPDTVPTVGGKPALVRRATYPMSDEVKVARQEIAKADAEYQRQQDWLAQKQKTTKGTDAYQRTLMQLRDDIEKTHKTKVERFKETMSDYKKESAAHDAQEKLDLKPRPLEGNALTTAEDIANKHFEGIIKQGDKSDVYKNSALRLGNTQPTLVDAVTMIKAINPLVPTQKIAEMVTTAVTHVGTDDKAKGETMNDHTGAKGSRFVVVGEDLARNPVIVLGRGNSETRLHVPRDTLNDLKRLKDASFKDVSDKLTADKNKPKTDYSTLVPGRVTETIQEVKDISKAARERAKAEGREMKPDVAPTGEMTPAQRLEADRKRRRQAADKAQQVEP